MSDHRPVFDLATTTVLDPALLAGALQAAHVDTVGLEQETVYWDTSEHALLRQRVTVARRQHGPDAGWHLELPGAGEELLAATGDTPPSELAEVVLGLAGGRPLLRVAVLRSRVTAHRLLDDAGELLAEIADDTVRAAGSDGPAATALQWREARVTLGPAADESTRRRAERALQSVGARRSPWLSGLARALGWCPAEPEPARAPLAAYVRAQVRTLAAGDVGLRRGVVGVHGTRVAVRRLRSTVRTFEVAAPDGLDAELRWYGRLLGAVRDPEVLLVHLQQQIAALPPELVLGRVRAELVERLQGERTRRAAELTTAMRSPRYLAMLSGTFELAAEIDGATAPTPKQLRRRAVRAARRADRRLAAARDDDGLHQARRAAKRARYAAELVRPVGGKGRPVRELRRRQDILGQHQDAVVAADLLRTLGAAGSAEGSNGFTYGLLLEQERQRADRARADVR